MLVETTHAQPKIYLVLMILCIPLYALRHQVLLYLKYCMLLPTVYRYNGGQLEMEDQ